MPSSQASSSVNRNGYPSSRRRTIFLYCRRSFLIINLLSVVLWCCGMAYYQKMFNIPDRLSTERMDAPTNSSIAKSNFDAKLNSHLLKRYQKYTKPYRPTIQKYTRKYPRILFFVHIHKSAGTFFCRLAFKNRVNVNHAENCNVQKDQYCCGGVDTTAAQIEYAKRSLWDMVATEREMYESMAPEYYDYVVTLRNSKSRYYSHYKHLRRVIPVGPGTQTDGMGDSSWLFGNNTVNVHAGYRPIIIPNGVDPLGSFSTWYAGQPDNWNTRILCGAKCRVQPKYQITKELFQYTLERLAKFKHFLFVEDLERSYDQLAQAYQWKNMSSMDPLILNHRHQSGPKANENVTRLIVEARDEWDPWMSVLDDAVYEFARRKFHNVSKEDQWKSFPNQHEMDGYFKKGPSRKCKDVCCGRCTSY